MKKGKQIIIGTLILLQLAQPMVVFAQVATTSAHSNIPVLNSNTPTISEIIVSATQSGSIPTPTPTNILAGLAGLAMPIASPSVTFNFLTNASSLSEASISATPALLLTPTPEPNIELAPIPSSARLKQKSSMRKLSKKNFRSSETVRLLVDDAIKSDISVTVTDPDGKLAAVDTTLIELQSGVEVRVLPKVIFRPGKFKITIRDKSSGQSFEQDFTWGVLAINTDKSVYTPGDTAAIHIAVLDEQGMMTCGAKVDLVIIDPIDRSESRSTSDKSIKVSDTCDVRDYVTEPDFSTTYKTTISGRYMMQLTATTEKGTYSITDAFEADSDVAFSVKRKAVTRIFPPKIYPVELSVVANNDFTGRITETVPQDFVVTPLSGTRKFDDVQIRSVVDEGKKGTRIRLGNPFDGNYPMTQGFGEDVTDVDLLTRYKQYGIAGHDGVDFALQTGTPVLAVDDGVVILAGLGAYGVTVVIQHDWGRSYYGHLNKVLVKNDQKVSKGTEIALSGNTGESTGPHLHFGMKLNVPDDSNGYKGKLDPLPYLNASLVDFTDSAVKVITWQVSMKKGESLTLGYQYKAPDVSPKFYLTGPLRFRASDKELNLDSPSATGSSNTWEDPFILGFATASATASESGNVVFPSITPTIFLASSSALATNSAELSDRISGESSSSGKADIFAGVMKQFEIQKRQATVSGQVLGNIVETKQVDTSEGVLVFAEKRQWQIAADALPADGDGIMFYGELSNATPRFRTYTNSSNTFSAETGTAAGTAAYHQTVKTSPTKQEAIALSNAFNGVIQVYCYDGTNWSLDYSDVDGNFWTADVAYETQSGDALVAWYTASTNELTYITKSGSTGCGAGNWSSPTQYTFAVTGRQYSSVKLGSDRRTTSNLAAVAVLSLDGDVTSVIWNGSGWTNEQEIDTSQAVDGIEVVFESTSGDVLITWATFGDYVYAMCTGGTAACSWTTQTTIPFSTGAHGTGSKTLCTNPSSNEAVFADNNTSGQLDVAYWSGSAWTATDALDGTVHTPINGTFDHYTACGFLTSGGTTRSVVVYEDSGATNIGFAVGNGSSFAVQGDFSPSPAFATPQSWYDVQVDTKNHDRLMLTVIDNNSDLFAKRLVMDSTPTFTWTNADAGSALESSLPAAIELQGQFAYWLYTSPALDTLLRHGSTLQAGSEGAFSF